MQIEDHTYFSVVQAIDSDLRGIDNYGFPNKLQLLVFIRGSPISNLNSAKTYVSSLLWKS